MDEEEEVVPVVVVKAVAGGEKTMILITVLIKAMAVVVEIVGEAVTVAAEEDVSLNVVAVATGVVVENVVVEEEDSLNVVAAVEIVAVVEEAVVAVAELVAHPAKTSLPQFQNYSLAKCIWALNNLCGGILTHKETCKVLSQLKIWNLGILRAI